MSKIIDNPTKGHEMTQAILTIDHLSKSYGTVQAVDDISFSVESGTLFSFLGINGAGKSTTINIICSILSKDAGTITVDGDDLDTKGALIKPKIGIVFQNTVLDQLLTVRDNLTVRASYYGLRGSAWRARLDELTSLLHLEELLKRPFGRLSGGQKRRVDIARGLINKPKLLILDEPTTGLDPQTRRLVWNIISDLRRQTGMTVFLTTHYMEEADQADRVVVIDGGHLVADDTPINLKNRYSGHSLLLYGVDQKLVLAQLDKLGIKAEATAEGVRIPMKDSDQCRKFLLDHPDLAHDFEFVKGNMDDVFLAVTGKRLEGGQL